ncbi:MAG: DUF433 domain-containing protein, partial [Planctomycetota bacterium]
TLPKRAGGERIPADSPLAPYISVDADRMHGVPCFKGSRVPIQHLFDHLRAGDTIDVFLDDFPPVTRAQVVAVIDLSAHGLLGALELL